MVLPKRTPKWGYVKIRDITLEVHRLREQPLKWRTSCEHTQFKGMCIDCIHLLRGMTPEQIEQEAELLE